MRNGITASLLAIPLILGGGAAHAGSWIPLEPSNPQPVGVGAECALVTERDGNLNVWRWVTTSLGKVTGHSTCTPDWTW